MQGRSGEGCECQQDRQPTGVTTKLRTLSKIVCDYFMCQFRFLRTKKKTRTLTAEPRSVEMTGGNWSECTERNGEWLSAVGPPVPVSCLRHNEGTGATLSD